MKKGLTVIFLAVLLSASAVEAVSPQKWELRRFDQFLSGTFKNISVTYDGVLSLSPKEEPIEGPAEEFYLSLIFAGNRTAYLGTGHSGKIYQMNREGKAELYFQVPEMDVCCLALDKKGNLYAGTSPNGKIYKITDKNKGEVLFDPREKYIWDLMFLENGNLLAAVGERGGIYEITDQGDGNPILKAEENHILCLMKDEDGNLFAGSGGKGHLYRISRNKRATILFESPFEEIKAISLDGQGNIYVAAGGVVSRSEDKTAAIPTKPETDVSITVTPAGAGTPKTSLVIPKQPSALYRVHSEGNAKRIWSSSEDLIYSLFWDEEQQRLIFGTGNRGRIFTVDQKEKVSLLFQKDSEQVYSLVPQDSKTYVLGNNPPKLSVFYPDQNFSGEYISRVFDTTLLSYWGRVEWEAELPKDTFLQVQTRSGNSNEPSQTWSDWSPPYQRGSGEQILNPKARYLQFKIMFKTDSGKVSPRLQRISLFYLQANVAPIITKLQILPANEVFLEPPSQDDKIWGLEKRTSDEKKTGARPSAAVMAKKVTRKGYQSVVWDAVDQNGDVLQYSILIRIKGDRRWRLLEERWTEKIYTFETLSFPDGEYFLRIDVDDSPSNPAGRELTANKESRVLVVDNSLPVIRDFESKREGRKLSVSFSSQDAFSRIREVKILVRPEGWETIFPVDGICDSKQEEFEVTLSLPARFDNMITVKVIDEHDNVGVHRATY